MPVMLAGGALLLAALAAGGYFGWRALQRPRELAVSSAPTPITQVKTVLLAPTMPVVQAPAPQALAPQAPAAAPVVESVVVPLPVQAEPNVDEVRKARRKEQREEKLRLAAEKKVAVVTAKPNRGDALVPASRQMSSQQRAEAEYRRALATLQEGRETDAIASLEQALTIDPHHEAARQTLVGLLIESKRPDEAARQLQQGLGADPRQPALAMLLARLQIERGWTGIETLQRTLPYATGNAEYHAFLAGALQRQLRHREAAEQYQAAVRSAPNNGVWLMGLGISLQAEKRNDEALDAFSKARGAGNLTPELQAFVDRKFQQLSH
jgi:MSHA biogenesis protein MshN